MSHRVLQEDVNRSPARCAGAGAGALRQDVAELRFEGPVGQGLVVMRQFSILSLAICLAAVSGCATFCNSPACSDGQPDGCNACCVGKRLSELRSPTDIRKTHFWCFGEDAVFHYPCGPKSEFYGAEPTCWREWPTSGAEWRDSVCGAQCGQAVPARVESGSAPPIAQPLPAAQPNVMGPTEPARQEKADQPREPMPVPAAEPTGLMERSRRDDILMPRTRGLRPAAHGSYLEPAALPRAISLDERPVPIAQPSASADIFQASFVSNGASSLSERTTGPSGSINPFFGAGEASIPSSRRVEPSDDRTFAQAAALAHAISFGDEGATIMQRTASKGSSQTPRVVSGEGPLPSPEARPSGSTESLRRTDVGSTATASSVEPDTDQSQDQEAALRRAISF
jgi:hypothetical protein